MYAKFKWFWPEKKVLQPWKYIYLEILRMKYIQDGNALLSLLSLFVVVIVTIGRPWRFHVCITSCAQATLLSLFAHRQCRRVSGPSHMRRRNASDRCFSHSFGKKRRTIRFVFELASLHPDEYSENFDFTSACFWLSNQLRSRALEPLQTIAVNTVSHTEIAEPHVASAFDHEREILLLCWSGTASACNGDNGALRFKLSVSLAKIGKSLF